MAHDRADWHYGGDYPEGLAPENGGTHIGMFLAWAIIRGLEGEFHREESCESPYYDSKDDSWAYLTDYANLLADDVPSLYHVADSWENFDRLAPILDRRYAEWKDRQS